MSPSGWRGRGSRPRSSRPTRARSSAASTSGPPRRPPPSAAASPTTASTSSIRTSRSAVADFAAHARAALAAHRRARRASRSSPAAPGCTCAPSPAGSHTDALPADPDVRARLEAEFLAVGLDPLVERLRAVAPRAGRRRRPAQPAARRPRARDRRRSTAATGPLPAPRGYDGPVAWIGLQLDGRPISPGSRARARAQFDAGLIEEARALRERFDPGLPAFSAIGYREAWAVLDGRLDREAAIAEDARRNAAFAKRQRTWFRSEPDMTWLDAAAPSTLDRAVHAATTLVGGER